MAINDGKTKAELAALGYTEVNEDGRVRMRHAKAYKTQCTQCHRWFAGTLPMHDKDRNMLCGLCFNKAGRSGASDRYQA